MTHAKRAIVAAHFHQPTPSKPPPRDVHQFTSHPRRKLNPWTPLCICSSHNKASKAHMPTTTPSENSSKHLNCPRPQTACSAYNTRTTHTTSERHDDKLIVVGNDNHVRQLLERILVHYPSKSILLMCENQTRTLRCF